MHEMLREYFWRFQVVLFPLYMGIISASGIAIFCVSRYVERTPKRVLVSIAISVYFVLLVAAAFSSYEASSPTALCREWAERCYALLAPWHQAGPLLFFWLPIAAMLIYAARVPRPNIAVTLLFGTSALFVGGALLENLGRLLHAAVD